MKRMTNSCSLRGSRLICSKRSCSCGVGPGLPRRSRNNCRNGVPDGGRQWAAVSTANGAQQLASAVRPKAAGAAQAVTGEMTTATSVRGGTPPSLHPTVQKFLDSVPQGARGRAHGRCCEPQLISNMLNAGVDPKGAAISVVRVRPVGNPQHATPMPPCSTCQLLLNAINK